MHLLLSCKIQTCYNTTALASLHRDLDAVCGCEDFLGAVIDEEIKALEMHIVI